MKTTQICSAWILSLGSLAVGPAAWADTITVCASGCNYTSINAAIAAAQNGDVIQLAAQTYL
ncbi:MAG: nitrous oxide reductase family maturation protein NosD, partial [Planctomycetota bacterium]|nr:nitrous oxide reductase family maturation protein NosD [Planctomycetota bacterium]